MKEILIIDDDKMISKLLEISISNIGYQVHKTFDGEAGLRLARKNDYALIILDITLPKLNGIEVCKRIRTQKQTPIIMLTGKTDELDKVLSLELGADDYVTKPFGIRELTARVKAVIRRSNIQLNKLKRKTLLYEELFIDVDKRLVKINESKINLSPKEFELLTLLASNPGKIYSRTSLLQLIWGYSFKGYSRTVNSHINRLRSKVELNIAKPKFILTEWGVGYKFNEELSISLNEQMSTFIE